QPVALAVDEPAGPRARGHGLAPAHGGVDAVGEEGGRERLAARDHAQADLGQRRVEGEAERPVARSEDAHDGAGRGVLGVEDVRAEDPGVAPKNPRLALAGDADRALDHFGGSGVPSLGLSGLGFWLPSGPGPGDPDDPEGEGALGPAVAPPIGAGEVRGGALTGVPVRASPGGLTAPSISAPSLTLRRFATNVPRARAVSATVRVSVRISPSNSPSRSTAIAFTLARTRPPRVTRRRPFSSTSPSNPPCTVRSCPCNVPEKTSSAPKTAPPSLVTLAIMPSCCSGPRTGCPAPTATAYTPLGKTDDPTTGSPALVASFALAGRLVGPPPRSHRRDGTSERGGGRRDRGDRPGRGPGPARGRGRRVHHRRR